MTSETIERANERREAQRIERCRRLLSDELGLHIRPASELAFDYDQATRMARLTRRKPA